MVRSVTKGAGLCVLVTGCSEGGIGYNLVRQFASKGCRVFASGRRLDAMAGLKELPGVQLVQLDMCDSGSIQQAVTHVFSEAGRIDILVNNAGVVTLGPAAEVPLSAARQCFETNVLGLLELCQAVFPIMAAQGSGKIINIGSLTGFLPVPLRGVYAASKAAVMRLTDSLRLECAPLGIQVMLVTPGFIATNARASAKRASEGYSSGEGSQGSMWGEWFDVLEASMRKVARKAVPADTYAAELVAVALKRRLPRYWVGSCAGLEWLVRFLPLPVKDRLLYRSLGLAKLQPVLLESAKQLDLGSYSSSGSSITSGESCMV